MSLTFFLALDRLLRIASAPQPVISAISSVSYSSMSFIRMMVRCRVGSESMISCIRRISSFISSNRSGVPAGAIACTVSKGRLPVCLPRHRSMQILCVNVMANASMLRYCSRSSLLLHSLSKASCTASSASSGSSVNFRA